MGIGHTVYSINMRQCCRAGSAPKSKFPRRMILISRLFNKVKFFMLGASKCMMSFANHFSKPHGTRKIVDIVHMETHGLYVNLEPMSPIEVGNYGQVDPETGRFVKDGNIYKDFPTNDYGIPAKAERSPDQKLAFSSSNGVRTDDNSGEGGNSNFVLRFSVVFETGLSVVLALIQPHITELPQPTRLATLASRRELRGLAVVDRVFQCPAYALVLTGANGGTVSMSFENTANGGKWSVSTTSGYNRDAILAKPECYVLYSLKRITADGLRDRRRGTNPVPDPGEFIIEAKDVKDDEELPDYDVPWGVLDDDGDDEYVDELDEHALAEIEAFGR